MARSIPVVTDNSEFHPPLAGLRLELFWVTADGRVQKDVGVVSVEAGVAVWEGPLAPPDAALRWALRIRDGAGAPVFRSGPLPALPGPGRTRLLDTRIALWRGGGHLDLDSLDGAASLLRTRIRERLPAPIAVDAIDLGTDTSGRYVIGVRGRVRIAGLRVSFDHRRPLRLQGSLDPGRPDRVVVAAPVGGSGLDIAALGALREALDEAITASAEEQLAAMARHIAALAMTVGDAGFTATTVSVGVLRVGPPSTASRTPAFIELCGGAVLGTALPSEPLEPVVLG